MSVSAWEAKVKAAWEALDNSHHPHLLATGRNGFTCDITGNKVPIYVHSVPSDVGLEIQRLMDLAKPKVSLEIGCAFGISSMFICEKLLGLQGKKHIIIDPGQIAKLKSGFSFSWAGLLNLESCNFLNLVEFHSIGSELALPRLLESHVQVEFAFVDGLHLVDQVMMEFYYIDKILIESGIVVFDDTNTAAVKKVTKFIDTLPHYKKIPCNTSRIAAYMKEQPDARQSKWFVEF